MMSKLNDIESQIAKLQREAAALRQQELDIAISKVKELVEKHGLTAEMIGLAGKRGGAGIKKAAAPASVSIPKYRDPKSGKTWTGKGKPPLWIAKARDRTRFLIDKPEGDVSAPADAEKPAKAAKAVKRARGAAKKAGAPAVKKAVKASAKVAVAKKAAAVKKAPAKAVKAPAPKQAKAPAKKAPAKKAAAKKAVPAKSAEGSAPAAAPAAPASA